MDILFYTNKMKILISDMKYISQKLKMHHNVLQKKNIASVTAKITVLT